VELGESEASSRGESEALSEGCQQKRLIPLLSRSKHTLRLKKAAGPSGHPVCGSGTQIPVDDAPRQVHRRPDFHTFHQTYSVSRAEVDTRRFPEWVIIFFKESRDATFVVPPPPAFYGRVGQDLSALIDKTREVAGNVDPLKQSCE
jgi:hypothetical protein